MNTLLSPDGLASCPPMHSLQREGQGGSLAQTVKRLVLFVACTLHTGCAALTNPLADGIPVRHLPPELLGESREGQQTIPLNLLRQKPPTIYRLAAGDVLGIWIEGVIGERDQVPPVRFAEREDQAPSLGFPFTVQEDGTVALPLIDPLRVEGLSLAEAEKAVRRAYTTPKRILQPGRERIIVTLMRPRHYHVVVIRQDSPTSLANIVTGPSLGFGGGQEILGTSKRGTGHAVNLPAYENDILNALARTGGLPGLDAINALIIERGGDGTGGPARQPTEVVRIPLRVRPGEPPGFRPEDVILQSGDVVFIEAREAELFYTGGLLPPGEHVLPRDYDLDVVEVITRVRGPLVNGAFASSNLNGTIIQPGIGQPNPSLLTVLRQVPGQGQVPIRVDLNRALVDERERILVQPGDVLVLQETPGEAMVRYFTQTFNLSFVGRFVNRRDALGTGTVSVP